MAKQCTFLILFLISSIVLRAQTLVHYWNFNNATDSLSLLAPTLNLVAGSSISHLQGGTSTIQITSNTGQGFDITNPNARNGDLAGTHLRFNNPIGGGLLFNLPTTGYDNVVVKYATRRSGSGAGRQLIFYTTNGNDFDSLTTIAPIDGDPELQTLDFTAIAAVNDNPNFAIRITFEQGAGGTAGNNRFDNFTLESIPPVDPGTLPTVSFAKKNTMSTEGSSDVQINLLVKGGGMAGTLNLEVVSASTAIAGDDYVLSTTSVDLPTVDDTLSLVVNVPDNAAITGGRYLILKMDTASNAILGTTTEHILLIADNEIVAPQAQTDPFVSLRHVGSFPGSPNGGSAEISAYDPTSKRLFITNITNNTLDILDFKDPVSAVFVSSIDMSPYGGGINSVAVKNGIVAAAVQGDSTTERGSVVFFDAMGNYLNSVTAGWLPDMVIFNNAGTQVLTANEGEPSADYSIDPLGSVSIVDLTSGVANLTDANVTTLTFESFDGEIDNLRAAGVRIFGPNATVGTDLEPEYICVSADDHTAIVTLQENNAIATIDLTTMQITGIQPLGYKDHSLVGNTLDASDQAPGIFMANWPIKGAYMPDALECFTVGGVNYAITSNEGDAREWGSFVESQRLSSLTLDSTAFPNRDYLKKSELLGRLNVLSYDGDTDGDGDLDEIYSFGGRSFSIWNLATGDLVWDSGDALETITAADPTYGAYFNASNGATPSRKNRSDDKGPESEGVVIAEIEGRTFAFVGLERIGGIMVYEVTNPTAPEFVQYINTRTPTGGDLGPEGIIFIPKNESPNGRNLIVLSNEISGTVSVFQVELDRTNGGDFTLETYDYSPTSTIVDYNGGTIYDGGISGLHYIPGTDLEFYAVSDRGPNADASLHPNATGTTLLFPAPDYAPLITRFKAENGAWTVQEIDPILRPDGTPISGRPLPVGAGNTGETAWADTTPVVLPNDIWGMDSEGIVEDNFGNLWLCDEYGASVWKINKATKQVIKRYTPYPTEAQDAALPAAVGKRRPNRGFEGVAITPNGKVYSMIQSPADNPTTAVGNSGRLLRLVEIDPETDAVRQFVYEIQPTTGQIRTRDWKVGDLVAVNNDEFLLVEHAERNGWNVKNIYKINIANATPLTTEDFGGQTLEQVGTAAGIAAFGVNVVEKTLMLDLLEAGWDRTHDKPEGLTIIDDNTIAVVNDNDFGINSPAGDGSIVFTGKTTRLYVYGLPQPLGYVSPYCTFDYPVASTTGCDGEIVMLDAGPGFDNYQWSNGSTEQTAGVTAEGNYSVTVTNGVGCKAIDSVFVNINPASLFNLAETLCPGESITVNGTVYNETNPLGTEVFVGGNVNGCDSVVNVQLSFYPMAMASISATICQGETYTVGSETYAAAGTYTVVLPNASVNGCDSTVVLQLGVNALPTPNLGANQAICAGQSTSLDAGAGFSSYAWSTGASSQTISANAAGNYSVTVTNANGCSASDELTLTVNPTPNADLGPNQTVCEGETVSLNAGAGFSSYAWSTGATGQSIIVTQTGTYSVVVTNANGCTDLDAITVFVNPAPVVDLGPDFVLYIGETATLDAGTGISQTYLWSDGSTEQTLTISDGGSYSVTVTSTNGCTSTDQVFVTSEPNAVHETSLAGKLNLFPNPTSGWVNLEFSEFEAGDYTIGIYDVTGRLLLSQSIDLQAAAQTAQLDLNHFPKGTYLVKIGSEKGVMARRVVVQ